MTRERLAKNFPRTVVAMVTPILERRIDEENLGRLIRFHFRAGTGGVLVCGTTGESATMSHAEHRRVIDLAAKAAAESRKEFPDSPTQLWAGTGSNSTSEALELTRHADKVGVDVSLLITPYYNKPTPAGLIHHYRTVAEAVSLPIVMCNVPSRTGTNLRTETVLELTEVPNIAGVKEASGDIQQISDIAQHSPEDFLVWSGDDALTLPILSVGGIGVISVTANIVPWDVETTVRAYETGNTAEALRGHQKLNPLHRAMFVETNPIPVKTAVNLLHQAYRGGPPAAAGGEAAKFLPHLPSAGELRPPMVPLMKKSLDVLTEALRNHGLI